MHGEEGKVIPMNYVIRVLISSPGSEKMGISNHSESRRKPVLAHDALTGERAKRCFRSTEKLQLPSLDNTSFV